MSGQRSDHKSRRKFDISGGVSSADNGLSLDCLISSALQERVEGSKIQHSYEKVEPTAAVDSSPFRIYNSKAKITKSDDQSKARDYPPLANLNIQVDQKHDVDNHERPKGRVQSKGIGSTASKTALADKPRKDTKHVINGVTGLLNYSQDVDVLFQ